MGLVGWWLSHSSKTGAHLVGHLFAVFWISKSVPLKRLKPRPEHLSVSHLFTSPFVCGQGHLCILVVTVVV